jgi:hypothetical protein
MRWFRQRSRTSVRTAHHISRGTYRPKLFTFEDRVLPGSMLTAGVGGEGASAGRGTMASSSSSSTYSVPVAVAQTASSGRTGTQVSYGVALSHNNNLGSDDLVASTGVNLFEDPLGGGNSNQGGMVPATGGLVQSSKGGDGMSAPSGVLGDHVAGAGAAAAVGMPNFAAMDHTAGLMAAGGTKAAPVRIAPGVTLTVSNAVVRTQEQMMAADGLGRGSPSTAHIVPINRPTMDMATFHALQQAAAQQQLVAGHRPGTTPASFAPPIIRGSNFNGTNQTESPHGFFPPDTEGTIGGPFFFETSNDRIDIFSRAGVRLNGGGAGVSSAAFFGYSVQPLFDQRVLFDSTWNRWIVTADAFPESATLQRFFIAVSRSGNPLGAYNIYAPNVTFNSGDFFDFPQLGMDQDALLFTANVFGTSVFRGAYFFSIAKALTYNGFGFSVPVFTGLDATLTPPKVLDQNANTYLLAGGGNRSSFTLYVANNTSHPNQETLNFVAFVTVPAYTVPPSAAQPGGLPATDNLDTSDCRISNTTTQIGNSLFATHTSTDAGFPTPVFYEINPATATLTQSGFFFVSGTSNDWNSSIVANGSGDAFVTWTSDNPGVANKFVQVRLGGRLHTDALNTMGVSGSIAFQSTVALTGNFDPNFGHQRWGDYSAVTIDTANSQAAWMINEDVQDANNWGTRITRIGF